MLAVTNARQMPLRSGCPSILGARYGGKSPPAGRDCPASGVETSDNRASDSAGPAVSSNRRVTSCRRKPGADIPHPAIRDQPADSTLSSPPFHYTLPRGSAPGTTRVEPLPWLSYRLATRVFHVDERRTP